jgi:acetate kinase
MAMDTLTLVTNPGSASRKYALYDGKICLAQLHFENIGKSTIRCTFSSNAENHVFDVTQKSLDAVVGLTIPLLEKYKILDSKKSIGSIGIRIVAPSSYFLKDRVIDAQVVDHLKAISERAPLHLKITLKEIKLLKLAFPRTKIIAVSDSAFHAQKPDYAWNYGIRLADADKLDIKRFGYHGLSVASIVDKLSHADKLPAKLLVCHLGGGVSVTAVKNGHSIDNTMGYTPLDGPVMATRSGSIDPTAVISLKAQLGLKDLEVEEYLNKASGLFGLSGLSGDIRELLEFEKANHHAELAIQTYIYSIQKYVGQMAAALNGCDALVFTGTIGVRSPVIRARIAKNFEYLDLFIDDKANKASRRESDILQTIHLDKKSKPIYVITTDESGQIAKQVQLLT